MRLVRALIFILCLVGLAGPTFAQEEPLTLDAIFASGTFYGAGFQGGAWAEEGPVIRYIERTDGGGTDLVAYNLETEETTTLIDGSQLQAEDVGRLIRIEDYVYSADGSKVLLYTDSERVWRYNTKGFYYVFEPATGELQPIADREAGYQMFAKLNPQGTHVAFVRDRNLFVVDLATGEETALTTSGSPGGIINGTTDWVYEEEFGLRDGFQWSPDGRYISFIQLDETETRSFVMADLRGLYPDLTEFRYPKAGEQNSEVRVGLVEMATGEVRFFDTDTWNEGGDDFEYIPQLGWTPEMEGGAQVYAFRMNRDQNELDVLYLDPETMAVETILEESSDTWLEVETGFSDLDVGQLTYLDDGEHFVWVSERSGHRHLYLYRNDGTLLRQLTHGDWDVTDFHGVDEKNGRFYFTAAQPDATERQLFRQPFTFDKAMHHPERITERSGWHSVNMSRDLAYYIDSFSDIDTPSVTTLHEADGEQLRVLQGNEELIDRLADYRLSEPFFTRVPGAAGDSLNAWIIRPSDFDPSRAYPLMLYVYGGPGSQTVRDAWGGTRYLWHQYLANELGVIVASVDNRGTGGRGNRFKTATYGQLGVLEAQDQIAAAQYLSSLPYVDADRTGIWGWSYGGFMTLNALLMEEGPETFEVGLAVAPVTTWRQYDTIYTERYLSTPQKNPEGYDVGSPLTYAGNLQPDQDLLIVHGDLDDNVHLQNTIQMMDAFQQAGKQFDLMIYPGRNHGIYGDGIRLHLFTLLTEYVQDNLVEREEDVAMVE